MELAGTGIWSPALRFADPARVRDAAAELESLGYSALWIPDAGGDVFGAVERLLDASDTITVATGILNLWMHTPEETAAGYHRLVDAYGDRFLVGIGVSHAKFIDAGEAGHYMKPLANTRAFLDGLDAATPALAPERRVLAALGPKMLELARQRTAGAHPYLVTPEQTAVARAALGDAWVLPEQAVVLSTDRDEAHRLGRAHLAVYLTLENYTNNFRRLGFDDDDFADGGSDRLIDALVAWGGEDAIRAHVQRHRDAGADHVCLQVLADESAAGLPIADWRRLASVLIDR
jgi:probable F420-dependent oxidoreductase